MIDKLTNITAHLTYFINFENLIICFILLFSNFIRCIAVHGCIVLRKKSL